MIKTTRTKDEGDIKFEDLSVSSDFTFYPPGHWNCSFMSHFNSTESILNQRIVHLVAKV